MRQPARKATVPWIALLLVLTAAISAFGQSRTTWRTAADIRNGSRGSLAGTVIDVSDARGEFSVVTDDDLTRTPIKVTTDSLVTTYRGFGATPAEETLEGTTGFSRLQVGDRVEISGQGAESRTVSALQVVLLGRDVAADRLTTAVPRTIDGTVREVSRGNRFVIQTDGREIYTVVGTTETPVTYRGRTYRILNLEPGDRVRVNVNASTAEGITARSIEVLTSVSESPNRETRTVTALTGRVSRVDARLRTFRVTTDRGRDVRIDAASAVTGDDREFRVADLRVGDTVEVTGEYDAADLFRANTIRIGTVGGGSVDRAPARRRGDFEADYEIATFSGRVITEWQDGIIVVEDGRDTRAYEIHAFDGFVVQTRTGYTNVERVKRGERVSVIAFVDRDGRLIAQMLRLR